MIQPEPVILLTGVADEAHADELLAMAARAGQSLVLAASPVTGGRPALPGASCLDLTSYLDFDECTAVCRASARRGQLVLVREPQLRGTGLSDVVRDLGLPCVALDSDVSYDTDPSWVTGRIEDVMSACTLSHYAIDMFTDVQESWGFLMNEMRPDELSPSDLKDICERFPILLSADITEENVVNVASFPGVRGVFLTCDETQPFYSVDRHVMSFEDIRRCLRVLLNASSNMA